MSYLDELLPEVTTETLAELLERPVDERPAEGLFFEFKSEFASRHIPKTVAAFANRSGGFLLFGTTEANRRLEGLPGLSRNHEWPREVSNNIVGHISPLPNWDVIEVPSPQDGDKVVVVVRVEESRCPPHIITTSGLIYQRSPGGTSDPITDSATLQRLFERGGEGNALVHERVNALLRVLKPQDPEGWVFSVISIPLPYESKRLPILETNEGWRRSQSLLKGTAPFQAPETNRVPLEDGVELECRGWNSALRFYTDGTVWMRIQNAIPNPQTGRIFENRVTSDDFRLLRMATKQILGCQRQFPTPVHQVHVSFALMGTSKKPSAAPVVGRGSLADPWRWDIEATTSSDAAEKLDVEFACRLFRAAGEPEYPK